MPLNLPTQNLVANQTTHVVGSRSLIWNGFGWDVVRPVVSATSLTCSVTTSKSLLLSGETSTITFTFSEAVTGFANSAVATSNGTLSTIAGAGAVYTSTFTPSTQTRNNYTAVIKVLANKVAAVRDATLLNKESSCATVDIFLNPMARPAVRPGESSYVTSTTVRTLNLELIPTTATVSSLSLADIVLEGLGTVSSLSSTGNPRTFLYTPPAATTGTAYLYVKAGTFTSTAGVTDDSPRLQLNLLTGGAVPVITESSGFGTSGIGAGLATLKITPPPSLLRSDINTVNSLTVGKITLSPTNSGTLSNLRADTSDDYSYLVDFQAGTNIQQTCTFAIAANAYQYTISGSDIFNSAVTFARVIDATPLTLVSRNPAAGATNASPQAITLTFNKTLAAFDLSKIIIKLYSSSGSTVGFVASVSGAVLSIVPTGGVDVSTTYYIELAAGAVSDTFTNTSPAVAGYTFTTASVRSGEQIFTASGTWTCPPGVTSVCAVAVGVGGAEAGGSLGWKNNIAVNPGTSYNITINDFNSFFVSSTTVKGSSGRSGAGRSFTGDGGGLGGSNGGGVYDSATDNFWYGGGGGAGGYMGNGGNGASGQQNVSTAGQAGAGGGGGGATGPQNNTYSHSPGGGGVGFLAASSICCLASSSASSTWRPDLKPRTPKARSS
jgi:hypothetical protein